eukprot:scaffold42819_cov54-Phaeocystis_antarctica.AAC.6
MSSSECSAERRPTNSAWLRPWAQAIRVVAFCVTHARSWRMPPSAVTSPVSWTRYTPKGHLAHTQVAKSEPSKRSRRTSKTGNDQAGAKAPATPRATVNHEVLTLRCIAADRTCVRLLCVRTVARRIDEPRVRAEHAPICVQHHNGRAFEPSYGCRGLAEVGMVQWARSVALMKRVDPQRRHPCASRAEPVRRLHNRRVKRAHVPRVRRRPELCGTCNHGKLQVDEHGAFVHLQNLRSMRTRPSAVVQEGWQRGLSLDGVGVQPTCGGSPRRYSPACALKRAEA